MKQFAAGLWASLLVATATSGWAQTSGVADDSIHIGRSAGLTGSLASRTKPATEAMQAYFDSVNAAGGINGRKIRFTTLDDGNDAKKAADNTRRLIERDKVFTMFANTGTAQTAAALEVCAEHGVPMVGTSSGADSIQAFDPLVFHYKASYGAELRRIAAHLHTMGITRVAVVHSPDPTGEEGRKLALAALKVHGIEAVQVASTKPEGMAPLLAGMSDSAKSPPQAVVLTALAAPGAAFFKALSALPQRPQVFTWSIIGVEAIHKEVGDKIRGLVVSQIVPSPLSQRSALAASYRTLMAARGVPDGGYPALEGYVAARILVEGLQRAGRNLTRERLVEALRGMRNFDLGGDYVTFGPRSHVGRNFVELTLVGADGRFIR
jgi:branched-chain amino acid transport system substrate-binding protein